MGVQTKFLRINKFGWKRVAKNTMRFGWELDDAVQHDETTYNRSYTTTYGTYGAYTKEHVDKRTKTRIHLTFYRYTDAFTNLFSVFFLELLYNLAFLVRRLIGWVLPLGGGILLFFALMGEGEEIAESAFGFYVFTAFFLWVGLQVAEVILSLIAKAILRRR